MSLLTEKIAQLIISRTRKIIPYNINIMNREGMIIASGESDRLHSIHEGARLVIQSNTRIDLTETQTSLYRGTKPGVNLPILYKEQLIGVIGITGPPAEVGSFGEIVKMTAELIVEQSHLSDQLYINSRMRDETILQFLNAEDSDKEKWIERGLRFKVDLTLPRFAVFFYLKNPGTFDLSTARRIIVDKFSKESIVIPLSETVLIALVSVADPFTESDRRLLIEQTAALIRSCDQQICAGLGEYAEGVLDQSYKLAEQTLRAGLKMEPEENLYDYRDLSLPVLADSIKSSTSSYQFRRVSNSLLKAEQSSMLIETLQAFFKYNGEIHKTADSLFIHRNTLRYRLLKIEEITGYSPKTFGGMTVLSLALMLDL